MARYLGAIQGRKGAVTRLGTAPSGIRAQAQGWNCGVTVGGWPNDNDPDCDIFTVTVTGGSNGDHPTFRLGEVKQSPNGKRYFHLDAQAIDRLAANEDAWVIPLD